MPKTSEIPTISLLTSDDWILVVNNPIGSPTTAMISAENLFQYVAADIRLNRATGVDGRFDIYINNVLAGACWFDDSVDNMVIENDRTGGRIVLNTNDGEIHVFNDATTDTVFKIDKEGQAHFNSVDADPDYIDGYGILYNYVNGSTRELRLRIKDGATEVQYEFPDKDTAAGTSEFVIVRDKKTQNTDGGTFTSGDWRTRDINEELVDDGSNCSLSSNQITLAAGTYDVDITCPAYQVNLHQARLYDITNSAVLITGTSEKTGSGVAVITRSHIIGTITLADTTVLEVQHQCATTASGDGFGIACNFTDEIYTVAKFEKLP